MLKGWNKLKIALLFLMGCFTQTTLAQGIVSDATEIQVLKDIYNNMNGANWNGTIWTIAEIDRYPGTVANPLNLSGVTVTNGDITKIDLTNRSANGPLPVSLNNLYNSSTNTSALKELIFEGDYITGTLPNLGHLTSLEKLNLKGNDLTGTVGSWIQYLTQLKELNLSTYITSQGVNTFYLSGLPAEINQLSNLTDFYFDYNDLSLGFPNMNSLGSLETLSCINCNLPASALSNIANISTLITLSLPSNLITDIPVNNWLNIDEINLSSNINLKSGDLINLQNKTFLKKLYLVSCRLTDLPTLAPNLEILWLYGNNFTSIPAPISLLQKLTTLYLSSCQITTIPSDFGSNSRTTLKTLSLSNNKITGLPNAGSNFYQYTELTHLYLDKNLMTGSMPQDFNGFTKLQFLSLNNNLLSGSLPILTGLTSLSNVDLSSNQFIGSVVNIFSNSTNHLTTVNLSNNRFTGILPPELIKVNTIDVSTNDFATCAPRPPGYFSYSNGKFENNNFDFGDIEPMFFNNTVAGPGGIPPIGIISYFGTLTYVPQKTTTVGTPQTIEVIEATALTLNNLVMPGATHNKYEWQKWDGTNWNTVQASSINNYVVPNVTLAVSGDYRMKITNDWVTGLTFYSAPITVVVLPPLCDSFIPMMPGTFKMDKVTGAIVFDRNDCTQDVAISCLFGPSKLVNNTVSASASVFSDSWDDGDNTNNPFISGERKWRLKSSYGYNSKIDYQNNSRNLTAGVYSYKPFNWAGPESSQPNWLKVVDVERYTPNGEAVQERNALKIASATRFGYNGTVPYIIAENAEYDHIAFESFEKIYTIGATQYLEDKVPVAGGTINISRAHAGKNSLQLTGQFNSRIVTTRGKNLRVRFWASGDLLTGNVTIAASSGTAGNLTRVATSGNWSLWESIITSPGTSLIVSLTKGSGGEVNIDDLRIQPMDSQVSCYVYDARTLRLLTIFDDQHFGMFYQYNEEGKLVRKQVETEKGIKTIQEMQYNTPKVNKN